MRIHAPRVSAARSSAGFSLVELTIVVVILGVHAMMAVPRYAAVVERSKASEAYTYLAHIANAQEMYQARNGSYADSLDKLSIRVPDPQHFDVGALSSYDWQTRWNLKLTRAGASSGFGAYSVAWNEQGFDAPRCSIPASLSPTGDGGEQSASSSSGGGSSSNAGSNSGSSSGGSGNNANPPANGSSGSNGGSSNSNGNNGNNGNSGNNGRGPRGNNGVGNGEGGGRTGNRGRGNR